MAEPAWAPAPTLRDEALDRRLADEGWVVVPFLAPEAVADLRGRCERLHADAPAGWWSDFYSPDTGVKREVDAAVREAFAPAVATTFADHRSLLHSFVINSPGPDGGLVLHQHSSVIDERRHRSVIVWCALTDATEANGTLHVVPRSHHVQQGPRLERTEAWFEPHQATILRHHLTSVRVPAGHALVFDNQLLHCSFANTTDQRRITAAAVVLPSGHEPRYYEPGEPGFARAWHLDPEFFLAHTAGELQWARPEGLTLIGEEPWTPTTVAADELADLLPAGTCEHG